MSGTRRRFFQDAAMFGAGLFGLGETLRASAPEDTPQSPRENENGSRHSPYGKKGSAAQPGSAARHEPPLPMTTPDRPDLPFTSAGATKLFHLIADPVRQKIAPF